METEFVLATLVQCVMFELVPGQQIVPEPLITLRPKSGIREWLRRDNLGSFIDQEGNRPDALYYAAYIIFYVLCFCFGILIISALLRFMQQNTRLPYRLRTIVAILAYVLGCICAVVAGINLGLSIVIGDRYRIPFNELYHALKAPLGILLMLSAAPGSLFALAARPAQAWTRRR